MERSPTRLRIVRPSLPEALSLVPPRNSLYEGPLSMAIEEGKHVIQEEILHKHLGECRLRCCVLVAVVLYFVVSCHSAIIDPMYVRTYVVLSFSPFPFTPSRWFAERSHLSF